MASWLLCYSRSAERFSMSKVFGSDLVENDRRNDLAIVGADAARLIWRDEGHLQSIAASAIAAKSKNADRQLGCDDEAAYSQARKDYSEFEADEADVLASL
jgi:hypothetical protein